MTRTIGMFKGHSVTIAAYVQGWRAAKALPPETMCKNGPGAWFSVSAAEIMREIEYGMHARINRHIPGYGVGRKWSNDWQVETRRAARDVNTPRLIVRWLPSHLKARLSHRLFLES